jgi:Secretion system C-terminal sorting domain/Beta-propeller repeat
MTKFIQNSFLTFILLCSCFSSQAQHTHFQKGDIFLGQGGGLIQWRDSNHVLIKTINTGDANSNGIGLRIHPITGQLWVTNPQQVPGISSSIRIINTDGTPGSTINIQSYQKTPTSITFDSKGNAYVGGLWNDTGDEIVKIDPTGTTILDHFKISSDGIVYGAEWVEMDCNDSIIYYTTLRAKIKRYNVITHQQLPDFADLNTTSTWLFAMRLLPDSTIITASADNRIVRINAAGTIIKNYTPANLCGYFGMAANPGGKSFWAGGLAFYGPMYKFDIASGIVLDSFLASPSAGINIYGIAVYGDELKNCKPQPPPDTLPQIAVTSSLRTYPNPSRGSFILQTNLTGKLIVLVQDKLGQTVYAQEYHFSGSNHNIPIDMRKLAAGIYFVQVISKDKKFTKKIVIN